MATKKILVDAHTFDEAHQGIRTFLKGIYTTFKITESDDIIIYLAANNIENLKIEFNENNNIKFIKLKFKNKYLRLAYEIPKIIYKHKFQFAHFNYYLPLFLNKKCKYIVTLHDVLFIEYPEYFPLKYRIINSFLFKRSAKKANILTTVSNYSSNQLKKFFNLKNKAITVLPNAVGPIYSVNHDKKEHIEYIKRKYGIKNYIIYVSRIEPRKNHYKLIMAYKELKLWERDIPLVLIGKTSFKDVKLNFLIEEVKKLSSGNLIRIKDVPTNELIKFYNAALLSVFPSLCEGFGIPPLESAALKTPTICSNVTAMTDFTFFKEYFFDASTIENIKDKIDITLSEINTEKMKSDFKRISSIIKKEYSWSNTSNLLKEIIIDE